MESFGLKSKFIQIAQEWKIAHHEWDEYKHYFNFLSTKKASHLSLMKPNEIKFTLKEISDSLNNLLDIIFVFNYIEGNNKDFKFKFNPTEVKKINLHGFNIAEIYSYKVDEYKHKKDLIVHFVRTWKPNAKKRIVRLNFSLLDHKYSWLNKDGLSYNISSLINAFDKQNYLWSNLSIKNQTSRDDLLAATINLDLDVKNLCEDSLIWLDDTSWAAFMDYAQNELAKFCEINSLDYHYSYNLSIKKINATLRNINYKINDYFLIIYNLYIHFRDILLGHKIPTKRDGRLKLLYINAFKEIYHYLNLKADCLKWLIGINNDLLPAWQAKLQSNEE